MSDELDEEQDTSEPVSSPSSSATTTVSLSMSDVHDVSLALMEDFEEGDMDPHVCHAALALTLGRMAAPGMLELDAEIAFIQAIMEFTAVYFAEGTVQ